VAFGVNKDDEGAKFFSRMSTAAHNTMESGHTGHFFNQMWTGLGAQVAGPEASIAFFKETRWLHTMNRSWDGSFTYDCSGYPQPIYSYRGLSDTGSHLLNLCLGRKKLMITGRDADESIWLKGADVGEVVSLATLDMKLKNDAQLLALFGHPMPKVRVEAVWTLRAREHKLGEEVKKMVGKGTLLERQSAIGYFGYGCPKEIALPMKDTLAGLIRADDESPEIRSTAAYAVCWLGEDAYPVYHDILRLLVEDKPDDPLGLIDKELGRSLNALCPNPFEAGLVTDRKLFFTAVRKLLDHKRAEARSSGMQMVAHMPLEDFHWVGDRVTHIIADEDLKYHSYHNLGAKTEAIALLGGLGIEGGMEAAMATLDEPTGKFGFKIRMLTAVLPKYGANAKPLLPKLKAMNVGGRFEKSWNDMLKSIEEAPPEAKMITLEEAMKGELK
jgi:hypothetical protein